MGYKQRRSTPSPCIVCLEQIRPSQKAIFCPECGEPYHRHCWKRINSKCIVRGCRGGTYTFWPHLEPRFLQFVGITKSKLISTCPQCENKISYLARYCTHCGEDVNVPVRQKTFFAYAFAKWLRVNHRLLYFIIGLVGLMVLYSGGQWFTSTVQNYRSQQATAVIAARITASSGEDMVQKHSPTATTTTVNNNSLLYTSTPRKQTNTPTATPTPFRPTRTPTSTPTRKRPTLRPPTPKPTATPTPTPTSIPACNQNVTGQFKSLWNKYRKELGCPHQARELGADTVYFVEQWFEKGHMFFFSSDLVHFVIVKYGTIEGGRPGTGTWQSFSSEPWSGKDENFCNEGNGLNPPIYDNFNKVWCFEPGVRDKIGYPRDIDSRLRAKLYGQNNAQHVLVQGFDNGFILRDSDGAGSGLAYVFLYESSNIRDKGRYIRDYYK